MDATTIAIALIGCLLVANLKPIQGLAVYVIVSIWYPYGVGTVSLGNIDFSAGRIVMITLFMRLFFGTDLLSRFKFIWLDRMVVLLFVAQIIAGLTTMPAMWLIENRAGDFFDMALPYFAVRIIVTDKQQYIILLKVIAWSVGFLALFGIYESLTGHNLLALGRYLRPPEIRLNLFHRAQATLRNSIYYGVFCGMAGSLCMGLLKTREGKGCFYKVLITLVFCGCFASMSSGGLLAMLAALFFVGIFRFKQHWKGMILTLILMAGLVDVLSNRHFYDVIDRFTFNSSTAWYRARLFEVALFEGGMKGHWLTGFGFADPMWGLKIDMRKNTDMVNHYLLILCRYGLVGFIPFFTIIVLAVKNLFTNFWQLKSEADRWLIWCVAGGMFAVLLAFNSVSLFGEPMTLLFMMFGICATLPRIIPKTDELSLSSASDSRTQRYPERMARCI